jgi:hypothetical protein
MAASLGPNQFGSATKAEKIGLERAKLKNIHC